jgi:perosamine synthetase
MDVIPVNEPELGKAEQEVVLDCVTSGWISSSGRYITEFEEGWAAYCGRRYGVAVSNGTAALEAAIASLQLKPGDEVILPTFTIISCVVAVLSAGATPVLVDCDPETWCMNPKEVAARVGPQTTAIMPVHIYGHPVDMDPILELGDRHGLAVVEDAAEAHGAEYLTRRSGSSRAWQRCGGFGTLSTFSFYANKLITTGEGGMVLTDDPGLVERLRSFRNLGFGRVRRFYHEDLGRNLRLTNLQAALGAAQLQRIDAAVKHKRWMANCYAERFRDLELVQIPVERPWARSVYWMYGIVLDKQAGVDAQELERRLHERGVETRPFFLGMHEQPALQRLGLFRGESYPVAERIARQGLYLPSGLTLTETQIDRVAAAVRGALG